MHSRPFGDQKDYAFSPDSSKVVFSARVAGKAEAWTTNFDLYQVPAKGGAVPKTKGIYGGFMMNWIAGNWPDGFQCIVNHAGTFDLRAMYYSTDEQWFNEWENGGTYYDAPAKHEKFNPVKHVKKWKTPMLLTQGGQDFRIPETQSFSTFTALQRRGIESKLLLFPDEGHIFNKPANSLLWNHTILDWLGKYLHK